MPPPGTAPASPAGSASSTAVARGGPWWAAWADLISFRPSTAIQTSVNGRSSDWYIHKLEDAYGDINLDKYPVAVSSLPSGMSAESLLEHVRTHINDFVDPSYSRFDPYDDKYPPAVFGDKARWLSSSPESAVISIQMRMGGTGPSNPGNWNWRTGKRTENYINPDDGSVVCAEKRSNYWIFSTLYTTQDKGHPVSGNRQFGFLPDPAGGYIFYTRGSDRQTSFFDQLPITPVFIMADLLWKSFQERLANYVNSNGGSATKATPVSERVYWLAVKYVAWKPTVAWIK
jgi:hypothetical protein